MRRVKSDRKSAEDAVEPAAHRFLWWDNTIVRFAALFAVLMVGFQLAYYGFVVKSSVFDTYMAGSARAAAALLGLVGETATASGNSLRSSFSVSIKHGCDGLQAMWILVAGVISFPRNLRQKLVGITVGIGLLLALNVVRIASLVWIGAHLPSWFQIAHVHAWPAILTCCAMLFWVAWATRAVGPRETT